MIKRCQEELNFFPQFIVLTSYEEFPLIKEAMKYQVIDYLVKLELDAPSLTQSVNKALKHISESKKSSDELPVSGTHFFYEKFMIRLLNNLFENEEQFHRQSQDLRLDFTFPAYVLCLCTIIGRDSKQLPQDKLLNLYLSTKKMVEEIAPKYLTCYVASLDLNHFCIIFCLDSGNPVSYRSKVKNVLEETFKMVNNYFNVRIFADTYPK